MQYTLILQNTVDLSITYFQVTDVGNNMYYQFDNMDFSELPDGSYKLYLIENNDNLPIIINQNNIEESTIETDQYLLVNLGNKLLNFGDIVLVKGSEKYQTKINIILTELMKVGDYKSPTIKYDQSKSYIQYNKK